MFFENVEDNLTEVCTESCMGYSVTCATYAKDTGQIVVRVESSNKNSSRVSSKVFDDQSCYEEWKKSTGCTNGHLSLDALNQFCCWSSWGN